MPPSPTAHTKGEPLPPLTSQSKDVLQKNEGLACGELTSTLGKEPMAEPQTPRERTDPVAPPTTVEADSLELPTGAHESLKDTSQNQQAVIARIDGVTIKSPLTESSDEAPAQKRPEKTATPVVPSAVSPAVPSKTRTLAETKQNTKAVAEITDVEDADSDRGPPVKPKKQAPPSGSQKRTSSVTTIPEPDNDTEDDDRFIILPGRKKKLPVSAVNAKDRAGRTLLFKYASQGLLETVESLIRVGAQINVNDYAGWSPLHEACNEGHEDVVRLLLAHGADPNIQGGNKDTPLHDALQNGHLGVIQLLLAHGSSLEALNEDGETPLDVMGSENDDVAALVSRWKEKTAQVTEQDAFGQTALHRASKEGNAALVKECLEHGSDVHAVDNSKWTALHEAALNGHVQVCSLLLSHSASVDAVGLDEDTPLHSASINSHAEVVELLLKYGAKRSLKDVNGKSPRDLASAPDVQLLLDAPPSAYKPFLKPIFGPAPLPQVNQSQQQADDESIDSDARIGGASGEQLMDWSYSNQSAGSDAKASSSKAAFSWGGLDPQRGTFESTREERKFQALLKKLEEADGEKSVSTPSSPQIVEHQKSLKSKTDTTPVKERKHKRDSSVSKKREKEPTSGSESPEPPAPKKPATKISSEEQDEKPPAGRKSKDKERKENTDLDESPKKRGRIDVASKGTKMEDISATPKKKTIREGLHSLKSSPEKNAKPVEETPAKLTKSGFDLKTAETQKVKSSVSVPSSIAEKSAVKEKNGSVTLQETPQERKIPKRSVVPLSQPKPPPPPAFEPPVVRKKVKKKSWLGISGYQSINHGASDGEIHSTESSGQQMVKSASQEPLDPKLISFYNKHCLPLYIITLRPGSSTVSRPPDDIGQRYFLDVQLGLFFGHNSGRAFLNSCPGITTRVAHTAEKEELETTPAAETVYSAMLHANASAAKWIKWIPTEIGSGKGLKMSDLDVHFVKEEDVRDKIALRMSRLREEWLDLNTDQPGRFTEELELTGTLSRRESVSSLVDLQAPETPVLAAAPPSLEERGDSHTGEKEGLVDTPEPSSTQSVVPSAPIHPAATPSEPEAPSSFYVHKLKRFK